MSEVEKMIAIGLVWGVTNAIMRRGALLWDQKLEATSASNPRRPSLLHERALAHLKKWIDLLLVWQYSIPFLVNLSASAAFFSILSDAPISLAVPVTNATTFAATAVAATALGEETRVWHALSGDVDRSSLQAPSCVDHIADIAPVDEHTRLSNVSKQSQH
ncbi:uncharacterized protein LOC131223022 isoform X3 [Magnolia sinica]|uniref:uncharacterized protein LOC131223022 isoform X3 n=1 Tax=Magnolia sinica TaxID=86752 RepID=UPI00265AF4A7|nr:uncharacterized protein LOC131223022 isoform X3 [Magnolia sinica]